MTSDGDAADGGSAGDTFGVGVQVTDEELRFVVHVPSDIDSGWSDPDSFQQRIEAVTWDVLDRRETLGRIDAVAEAGDTVTLGTVTMQPGGDVTGHTLSAPRVDGERD
ncbi:hypothetical protein [Halobaculum sp. P14]|uniref:hypothetical protein n=1 Tax=Halobaculum sp. P14 TaxID=3421638 RepID=UPI003EBB7015